MVIFAMHVTDISIVKLKKKLVSFVDTYIFIKFDECDVMFMVYFLVSGGPSLSTSHASCMPQMLLPTFKNEIDVVL